MGVDHGGLETGVSEKNLDHANVYLVFQKPGGVTVPKSVGGGTTGTDHVGSDGCLGKGDAQGGCGNVVGAVPIGEQPPGMSVRTPDLFQLPQQRVWQRDMSLLVALTHNLQDHAGTVDGMDIQGNRLADPQPAGIHESKASAVAGMNHTIQESAHILIGKGMGQAFGLGFSDLFFPKRDQSLSRVWQ